MREFVEYPKWKYHATEAARMVNDAAEEKALGDEWYDRPDLSNVDTDAAKTAFLSPEMAGYTPVEYPKLIYNADGDYVTVENAEEEAEANAKGYGTPVANNDGLDAMRKADLVKIAAAENVSVEGDANKATIIAAIRAKRAETPVITGEGEDGKTGEGEDGKTGEGEDGKTDAKTGADASDLI